MKKEENFEKELKASDSYNVLKQFTIEHVIKGQIGITTYERKNYKVIINTNTVEQFPFMNEFKKYYENEYNEIMRITESYYPGPVYFGRMMFIIRVVIDEIPELCYQSDKWNNHTIDFIGKKKTIYTLDKKSGIMVEHVKFINDTIEEIVDYTLIENEEERNFLRIINLPNTETNEYTIFMPQSFLIVKGMIDNLDSNSELTVNQKLRICAFLRTGSLFSIGFEKMEINPETWFPLQLEVPEFFDYDYFLSDIFFGAGNHSRNFYTFYTVEIFSPGKLILNPENLDKYINRHLLVYHGTEFVGGNTKAGKMIKFLFRSIDFKSAIGIWEL